MPKIEERKHKNQQLSLERWFMFPGSIPSVFQYPMAQPSPLPSDPAHIIPVFRFRVII